MVGVVVIVVVTCIVYVIILFFGSKQQRRRRRRRRRPHFSFYGRIVDAAMFHPGEDLSANKNRWGRHGHGRPSAPKEEVRRTTGGTLWNCFSFLRRFWTTRLMGEHDSQRLFALKDFFCCKFSFMKESN